MKGTAGGGTVDSHGGGCAKSHRDFYDTYSKASTYVTSTDEASSIHRQHHYLWEVQCNDFDFKLIQPRNMEDAIPISVDEEASTSKGHSRNGPYKRRET